MMPESFDPVQGAHKRIALHTIGWSEFQSLCHTIVSCMFNVFAEKFSDTNDLGMDGGFYVPPEKSAVMRFGSVQLTGNIVIQCKHTSSAASSLSWSRIEGEAHKASVLCSRKRCDVYILMTNHTATAEKAEKIRSKMEDTIGCRVYLLTYEFINKAIVETPKLRSLVPMVYGLGDLSVILDVRAEEQADAIFVASQDDLKRFVPTSAYHNALDKLESMRSVVIVGDPMGGKTATAMCLLLSIVDRYKCRSLIIASANDFTAHWNPNADPRIYLIDDMFGSTRTEHLLCHQWNEVILHLNAAHEHGSFFVITSRSHIYKNAITFFKANRCPVFANAELEVNIQDLTLDERKMILYNHIKYGNHDMAFKRELKPHLSSVAASTHFLPETARRLGNSLFTKGVTVSASGLNHFVSHSSEVLTDLIRSLDHTQLAALLVLYSNDGSIPSPLTQADPAYTRFIYRLGVGVSEITDALRFMDGSLVQFVPGIASHWTFKHPSILTGVRSFVSSVHDYLDIYIAGAVPEVLLKDFACASRNIDLALTNATPPQATNLPYQTLPFTLYEAFIRRVETCTNDFALFTFLNNRSDRDLINQAASSAAITKMAFDQGRYFETSPGTIYLATQFQYGNLSEADRTSLAESIIEHTVDTPCGDVFTDARLSNVLTPSEMYHLHQLITNDITTSFSRSFDYWKSAFDPRDDVDLYFEPLLGALTSFRDLYPQGSLSYTQFANSIDRVWSHIEDVHETQRLRDEQRRMSEEDLQRHISPYAAQFEEHHPPITWQSTVTSTTSDHPRIVRDIFDDVDQ